MNSALLLRGRNALYPVYAALVLKLGIDFIAFNNGDHFLQAPDGRLGSRENFHLPALRFRITGVHAENLGGKQGRLIAAGPRPDFEHDVLLVIRIFGKKQNFQFFLYARDSSLQLVEFLLSIGAHLRVLFFSQKRLALGDSFGEIFILSVFLDNGRNFAMSLGSLLVSRRVIDDLWRRESVGQLLVTGFDLVETFKHRRWSLVVRR